MKTQRTNHYTNPKDKIIFSLLGLRSSPNALWCSAVSAGYVQKTLHVSKLFGKTFGFDTGGKKLTYAKHDFFTLLTARPENLDMSGPVTEGYTVFSEIIRFIIEHQQEDDAGYYLNRWLCKILLPNNLYPSSEKPEKCFPLVRIWFCCHPWSSDK